MCVHVRAGACVCVFVCVCVCVCVWTLWKILMKHTSLKTKKAGLDVSYITIAKDMFQSIPVLISYAGVDQEMGSAISYTDYIGI